MFVDKFMKIVSRENEAEERLVLQEENIMTNEDRQDDKLSTMKNKTYFGMHNHTDLSNLRLRDSTNHTNELLERALEAGLTGIAISDHETLSAHIKADTYVKDNAEKFKDFTLAFGNEIYLVDDDVHERMDNNEPIKFNHFLMVAKNDDGYTALKELSNKAWNNYRMYRGQERVPTTKSELAEVMANHKGNVIASSSCVGGELPQLILKMEHAETADEKLQYKKEIHKFITFLINCFGKENLHFELQPSYNYDQNVVNPVLYKLSKAYDIKPIVTTDAHYLSKDQALSHEGFLQASEGDREVKEFYATTYVFEPKALLEYFTPEILDELFENTLAIPEQIEEIHFYRAEQIPRIDVPIDFEVTKDFDPYLEQYEWIKAIRTSSEIADRYYLHLLADGMKAKNLPYDDKHLSRINLEMEALVKISERLEQPMTQYFITAQKIVDLMWVESLVGTSRGSACCWLTNYILDIVQVNPLQYDLPYWRFLSAERAEMPKHHWACNVNVY